MSNQWKGTNRHKYLLQFHLIFVCKYRKHLLARKNVADSMKELSQQLCEKHGVLIKYVETDKDHIHYMIEIPPTVAISDLVRNLKSYTTYHIWKQYPNLLQKEFWKEHTFWTDGYFCCSVGNISERMLKEYIENQG